MKAKLQLLTLSLLVSYYSFGQNPCISGVGRLGAVMNNYQAWFLTDNDMFWDYTAGVTKTFIPKYSNSSPIFNGSIWMGGYKHGVLHTAAMVYRQQGVDFWPGPMDTTTFVTPDTTDSHLCQTFDTFFPIRKTQVDSQKNHLYTAGTMPAQITNWPANGLPAYHTSYKLAPYQDVNHNNTYDPLNGDYPIMYGDYSIYQITNDVANVHGESGGLPIGVEIHTTNYIIDCTNDSALWNTLFMHFDVINRSPDTVTNFLFNMWSNFDLGDYRDDYVGCDTNLNMYYVYNGDGYDHDVGGLTGYHQYLPAFAGVFLNQKLSRFTHFYNTGDPQNGFPSGAYPQQFYNLMNGVWENGTPMTYGNEGLTAGNQPTYYLFSGDPVTNTGWTEPNSGQPPCDESGQGSCGPFTFYPHDTLKVDFAYVFARDYTHPGDSLACIPILKQYVQNIQNYYNTNTTPCGSTFSSGIKQVAGNNLFANIYPNPSMGNFTIESSSIDRQTMQVYDVNGKMVLSQIINGKTSIDAGSLNEGVYNISLQSNESVINKRMVIVR